jgi:anthranilate synthase component 1
MSNGFLNPSAAISPSREQCAEAWGAGAASVVFSVEPADLLTPVAALLRLRGLDGGTGRNTLLLESVEGGACAWSLFDYRA